MSPFETVSATQAYRESCEDRVVVFTHQERTVVVSPPLKGLLLVGTDGFFNYAKPNAILAAISKSDFQTLPRRCIAMVRLPSGDYWDDIGIVAVRHRLRSSTRQRFNMD